MLQKPCSKRGRGRELSIYVKGFACLSGLESFSCFYFLPLVWENANKYKMERNKNTKKTEQDDILHEKLSLKA